MKNRENLFEAFFESTQEGSAFDRIVFTEKGGKRELQVSTGGSVVRVDSSPEWTFEELCAALSNRAEWGAWPQDLNEARFFALYGSDGVLHRFEVHLQRMLSGQRRVMVRLVESLSLQEYLAPLRIPPEEMKFLSGWPNHHYPVLVTVAGKIGRKSLLPVLSAMRGVCAASSITELEELLCGEPQGGVLYRCEGNDSGEVLESIPAPIRAKVWGVVGSVLVPKICGACAKHCRAEARLLEYVPEAWRDKVDEGYKLGRGCAVCQFSGSHEYVALTSIASPQELVMERSLFESGLPKVAEGTLTLEALIEHAWPIPHRYREQSERPISGERAFRARPDETNPRKPIVLVVEDDPDQRDILAMVLGSADYDVATAVNGRDALLYLRKAVPDLIVSDLMMPELDGAQMLLKLKEDPILRNIPVLILTVVSDTNKEFDLLSLGADDYCEKTIQRKVLLKRIDNLIQRGRQRAIAL